MNNPETKAATKIPVPVAESQLSVKIASSGFVGFAAVGGGTTGGVRTTTLCNCTTGNFGAVTWALTMRFVALSGKFTFNSAIAFFTEAAPLKLFFTCGTPQMKTNKLRRIHGTHARVICCR